MTRRPLRHTVVFLGVLVAAALLWPGRAPEPLRQTNWRPTPPGSPPAKPVEETPGKPQAACATGRPLVTPTGRAPRITCAEARGIIAEIRARFAGSVHVPREQKFADLLTGWLDPHGLWSAAPDAPFRVALRERTHALLVELTRHPDSREACAAAAALGGVLSNWMDELRGIFDDALLPAGPASRQRAIALAMASVFQDDPVTERAQTLARTLAERLSAFEHAYPQEGAGLVSAGRSRYFPDLGAADWSEVVLAAAVRAYVPLVDPHGDWAPFEEEWSLYAEDPGLDGDPRLWGEITRTAVGVRVLSGPLPPLDTGDLVLSVDGIRTAGMPLEQAEQLGRLEPGPSRQRRLELLRHGQLEIESVSVDLGGEADPAEVGGADLETEHVRFGDFSALVVRIADVDDGLGPALARALLDLNRAEIAGVLLDLRGNGGGSADAAAEALGLFLPGAPLFPLSARGRLVEVVRAAIPASELRYQGPLATLVDGYTASAAEMIAGALSAYGRGPVLGARTFGKGCIQEYADDHTGRGVLRLTTLLFALPDGAPVQRIGLIPSMALPIEAAREHESDLLGALPEYRGPDVRNRQLAASGPWPAHRGRVGPCRDRAVCAALRRLGASEVASRPKLARRLTSRAVSGSGPARP